MDPDETVTEEQQVVEEPTVVLAAQVPDVIDDRDCDDDRED